MQLIGAKNSFAIGIGQRGQPMRTVEIWVGGENITRSDSVAYLPAFLPALQATERTLKERLNFLRYEGLFLGLGVEEAFTTLRDAASLEFQNAWPELRYASWGPTTDGVLCFLLPIQNHLFLACQELGSEDIHSAQVTPYELIRVLESTIHELTFPAGA